MSRTALRTLAALVILAGSTACQEFPVGTCGRYRVHFPNYVDDERNVLDQRLREPCSNSGTTVSSFDEWTMTVDGEPYVGVHQILFRPTNDKDWAKMSYNWLEAEFPQAWFEVGASFEIPAGVAYHCNFSDCWGHVPLTAGTLEIVREGKTDDLWGYTNYKMRWEVTFGEPDDPESRVIWATGRGNDWVSVADDVWDP